MAIYICEPGDKRFDTGTEERLYPIPQDESYETVMYDKEIQQVSYIQANIVAVFDEWFCSFFDPNYFKYKRIKTTTPFSEFKSDMKNIYKKEMPLLVIDPSSIEHVEDSLFGTNMINRYNMVDPTHDNISGKLVYSLELMKDNTFELHVRRNRYRFEINTMIMERTIDRQINTYNMMIMNFRHNSKFLLPRSLLHMLPLKYIINIANFKSMNYKSDEYMKYINTISHYPIVRRILPNGNYMFFAQIDINIQVEIQGLPSKDSPEMAESIEWGARVVDNFIFIADLPSEFIFLTTPVYATKYDKSIKETSDDISYISPYYSDLNWPEEFDGYKRVKRIDIEFEEGDTRELNIISAIEDYDPTTYTLIQQFIANNVNLTDILRVKAYPNGSYEETGTSLSNDGTVKFLQVDDHTLYTINIYLNYTNMNKIKELSNTKHIGTIEKY